MKIIKHAVLPAALLLLAACNSQGHQPAAGDSATTATTDAGMNDSLHRYSLSVVDGKKDLVCGMPLTAALKDTAHYKGKVYGFCSDECKSAFIHTPEAYVK
jgi:YHS domain-containing protein